MLNSYCEFRQFPSYIRMLRPSSDFRFRVALDGLTERVRAYRKHQMATRDELKALRLKAMGVVGDNRQATAGMYNEIIELGGKVADARAAARDAHMGDLNEQIGDLKEDLEELGEFEQKANPPKGAGAIAAPAKPTTTPATASAALAALNAAAPPKLGKDAWDKGDAYEGTHPEGITTVPLKS